MTTEDKQAVIMIVIYQTNDLERVSDLD